MSNLILHLGGGLDRADKCIELAKQFPNAPVLVSSEGGDVLNYYTSRGIDASRVFIDNEAWDTVTNFTATYKRVKEEFKADTVYVVTHNFHMRRSMIIAQAVYWRRGITSIASPSGGPDPYGNYEEPSNYVEGDAIRSWVWRLTGLLFYWKKVREDRSGIGTPVKWNEIGL
jgi:uncharacterized SAM-binding protein YcdF (DUF218 family)